MFRTTINHYKHINIRDIAMTDSNQQFVYNNYNN